MKKITLIFIAIILFITSCSEHAPTDPANWRGVWVTNVDSKVLDSKESIDEAMEFLAKNGFNVVMPVVWNDAYTLYPSKIMQETFGREMSPRFEGRDPLKELIESAHKHDLQVIAWFEYGFSSSYNKNGGELLKQKPEWAARDKEGNLLKKNSFEWMNAYMPEVQNFLIDLVMEVVKNYDVDGVQGDDRLPAQPSHGGYSRYTIELYKSEHNDQTPPPDYMDKEWLKWRGDKLNAFAKRLYDTVKAEDENVLVTWAPSVYPWCYEQYLQDWPEWIRGGYADVVIPQVYRYNMKHYISTLKELNTIRDELKEYNTVILPGVLLNVGNYVMDEDLLFNTVEINRKYGYNGEVFFFYEGLRHEFDKNGKLLNEIYQEKGK